MESAKADVNLSSLVNGAKGTKYTPSKRSTKSAMAGLWTLHTKNPDLAVRVVAVLSRLRCEKR